MIDDNKIERGSFIFYRSFKEALEEVGDADKLIIYEAICDYALDKKEPINLTGYPKALFRLIKPQLDANWKRYEAGVKYGGLGAEYGKKGGRPKKETLSKPSNIPLQTEFKPSNVNHNENLNDNEKGNVKANAKRFIKPTLDEVSNFISENSYIIDAEKFFNYYESNGWKVGRNSMKDWKATVRNWNSTEKEKSSAKKETEAKSSTPVVRNYSDSF